MDRCWILLGMMGSGKTTVGQLLARKADRLFWDTDSLLQAKLGRPVSQLFHVYGEEAFRSHETALLASLEPAAAVLSTGGGIVVRPENWQHLRRLGHTVYVRVAPEVLKSRLKRSKRRRPLLWREDWQDRIDEILAERHELYEQADETVDIGNEGHDEVVEALHRAFLSLAGRAD